MAPSVSQQLHNIPRKALAMKHGKGETSHKPFVVPMESRLLAGRIIDRAIYHTGLSKKEAAHELGYRDAHGEPDQSPISRWIAGLEPAPLARFVASDILCAGLAIALAEHTRKADIQTVISMRRLA